MTEKRLYIVAGMHRSGTSVFSRMLEAFDVSVQGNLRGPAEDNQKGFWEDLDIVELNDRVLAKLGLGWQSLDGFQLQKTAFSSPRFNRLKSEAGKLLAAKLADKPAWGCKDPRFSRLHGFWAPIIKKLKLRPHYLIAIRDPAAVAASLAARNGFDPVRSQLLWFLYNADILSATAAGRVRVVHYEAMLRDPRALMAGLAAFFDKTADSLDRQQVEDFCTGFVDESLQHSTSDALENPLPLSAQLYALTLEGVDRHGILKEDFAADLNRLVLQSRPGTDLQMALESAEIQRVTLEKELCRREQQLRELDRGFREEEDRLSRSAEELQESVVFQQGLENALRKDIDKLVQSLADSEAWTVRLQGEMQTLTEDVHKELARADAAVGKTRELAEQVAAQDQELTATREELSGTSQQLTATREELTATLGSLSWRLTRPLRRLNYQSHRLAATVPRAAATVWGGVRGAIRSTVYLLPRDSRLRQAILQVYLRLRAGVQGDLDGKALRLSHQGIIANRQKVLGGYRRFTGDELPDLDISIVTHNSQRWVEPFLQSLLRQNYPLGKIALLIVDNDSSDQTLELLNTALAQHQQEFRSIQIRESANVGFGAGHNKALALGSSSLVLVSNVDLEYTPDCLVDIVSFASGDDAAIASWEMRQQPFEHPKFYDPVTLQTGWSSHACILMRRELFNRAGGYEEKIFMYGEDVELSYRFRSLGYGLRYFPSSVVYHHTYEEAGELKPLQFYGSTLSNAYLRLRYGSLVDILSIPALYAGLLAMDTGLPDSRRKIFGNIGKLLRNTPYFLGKRRFGQKSFPFRHWDYELVRDGAFYQAPEEQLKAVPLVSVVTRTYQGREYLLRECMQSVFHQTWPKVEIVIVEDGGNSAQSLAEDMAAKYPDRIVRYKALPKLGRCRVGNEGLEMSQGKYVMFLDDDDLLFCDHIETCVLELEADTALGGVYALPWDVETRFHSADLEDGYEEMSHSTTEVLRQEFDREVMRHHNYIAIQSIVFRRELYERYGGFDVELDNLEDWNLWLRYSSESDFKLVNKTTSMYKTPWDIAEKSRRQLGLDGYYKEAREKNEVFLKQIAARETCEK